MAEPVVVPGEGGNTNDGYQALADLNGGFMGTGYSTDVELAFIGMALIATYVAVSTARYFLAGTRIAATVAGALGLRED